jgi:hypothetical protein
MANFLCASLLAEQLPPAKLSGVTPELRQAALKALEGISGDQKAIQAGINQNGVYSMEGDVFGDGLSRAVLDLNGTVVLCSWEKHQWQPSVYFKNFKAEWLRPGWNEDLADTYKPSALQ